MLFAQYSDLTLKLTVLSSVLYMKNIKNYFFSPLLFFADDAITLSSIRSLLSLVTSLHPQKSAFAP